MWGTDGTWNDAPCTKLHSYVVQFTAPVILASNSQHYELVTSMLAWPQAIKLADSSALGNQPGAVVSVRSAKEEGALRRLLAQAKVFDAKLGHATWIAARYDQEDGNWQWMDGDGAGTIVAGEGKVETTFTHWAAGQPTLLEGSDNACVEMASGTMLWSASKCWRQLQVIVEYEKPDPSLVLDLDAASYSGQDAWKDLSGSGNDAILSGADYDERRGFRFGAVGSYARVPELDLTQFEAEMTIEVYFWSVDADNRPGWLVALGKEVQSQSVFMGDASTGGVSGGMGDAKYESGLGVPSPGRWHHVIAVFNQKQRGGSYLALDGQMGRRTTAQNKREAAAVPLYIGGNDEDQEPTGANAFIQVVRLYSRAFSPQEALGAFERFAQRNDPDEVIPTDPPASDETVLANLRGDYDRHTPVDARPAGHIPDESGSGAWDFYASTVPNGRDSTADLQALVYQSSRIHEIVNGDAYVNLESDDDLHFPAVKGGQLVDGEADAEPEVDELSVHPGDPAGSHPYLIIRYTAKVKGPVRVQGALRNLGVRSLDGVAINVLVAGSSKFRALAVKSEVHTFEFIVDLEQETFIDFSLSPNEDYFGDQAGLTVSISRPQDIVPTVDPDSGASGITPAGFFVLGFNQRVDLSGKYTGPKSQGATATYVKDNIRGTDVNAIEFVKSRNGQTSYNWFGFRQNVTCGETVEFGVWVKFVDRVPDLKTDEASNFGLKHHGDPDHSAQGDPAIYSEWANGAEVGKWMYVTKTWIPDYSAEDLLILIFDSVNAGTTVRFADMSASITPEKPDQNYALDDFNEDVTPVGFEVLGFHENIDLTTAFQPRNGGCTAVYVNDVPSQSETSSTRSIKFTKSSQDGQVDYCWFGQRVTVCKGDHITFSVWIKFIDTVPPKSSNFGLKHHGDPDHSAVGDPPIFNDFVDGASANEWMHVTKTWISDYSFNDNLLLIFDTVPAGQEIHFTDMSIYKVSSQPSLFFNGKTDFIEFDLETTGLPEGNGAYTIEAWVRPMELPKPGSFMGIAGWGDPAKSLGANQLKLNHQSFVVNAWDGLGSSDYRSARPVPNLTAGFNHIAATYDGARRTVVINGVAAGSDIPPSGTHDVSPTAFRIGVTGDDEYFFGFLSHVRVWACSRTVGQIKDYHDQVLPADAPGLIGDWHLDDGGSVAADSSGTGLDGVLRGPK